MGFFIKSCNYGVGGDLLGGFVFFIDIGFFLYWEGDVFDMFGDFGGDSCDDVFGMFWIISGGFGVGNEDYVCFV